MTFLQFLTNLNGAIRVSAQERPRLKKMIARGNYTFVLTTKDGKVGRRFIFKDGKYSSDRILNDFDLAFVFKDAATGLNTLALGGDTGLREAMNNWDLELRGDKTLIGVFGVIFQVATGSWQRD
ncbi:MAG: hypothetical protein ABSG90_14055 [Dehalococcoidia bacterium]|jgi:hypothetical protein